MSEVVEVGPAPTKTRSRWRKDPRPNGTLSRQLVTSTTALVALVTIALSLFTALASFQILQNQLDDRLESALASKARPGSWSRSGDDDQNQVDPGGSGLVRIDHRNGSWSVTSPVELTDAELTELIALTNTRPETITTPSLGQYRFQVARDGETIVGLPYSQVSKPMSRQLLMAGLLTAGAIVLSYLGARRIVERSLRPLQRLALTATQVSQLPLASGEGTVPVRVQAQDADPSSEVGQVGLAFNYMLDNVENALAARHRSETKVRQFVADASHELRNPLASIRGYAELTRRGSEDLPADTVHAIGRIESESERMSALVQDLLLLARLDSEPTLELGPVDLTEIVLNAVSDARAADAEHVWELNLPEDLVVAKGDPHRLHQVVANLLANARSHTPAGTRVETALRTEGDWAVIAVTDNGPGVPAEIKDSVFERFTRADASRVRKAGGSSTGLGLAIVSAVVNAHGGQVGLESEPGRTSFLIRVPLV